MDISKLIDSAAALPPFYADVCMLAADEIKALRAKLEDPGIANLRCLEGSVRNLIAALCRHDGRVLRDCIPSTGTISGDLYAIVASAVRQQWDDDTLSDLQRRYPLPKPVNAAQAGNDGSGELPSVPCEVSDGGGSAEHRGVCGSADEQPALTAEQQELCELFDSAVEAPPAWMQEALEQARSTTRRNILAIVETMGAVREGTPEQDIAVAMAALLQKDKVHQEIAERAHLLQGQVHDARQREHDAVRALVQRQAELLGTIKGRDKTIDRLCRHIAFQVAK